MEKAYCTELRLYTTELHNRLSLIVSDLATYVFV